MADINWDPPATLYIYNGDLYCPDCASEIEQDLCIISAEDSNIWPQEYSRGAGESDTPDHCGTMDCQRFLGRTLTSDGIEYVRESARDALDRDGVIGLSLIHI